MQMESKNRFLQWRSSILRCLFLSLFFLSTLITYAQVTVRGKVVDATGETLIGVNVIVKGTSQGTITDTNGEFNLSVPSSNSTLIFSYVGFVEQEIPLNGRNFVSVVMEQDTELLDEIIVVGYGTQRRTSVTGAVSTLSNTELIKAPVVGVTNVLGARVAGVTSLQQSGQPGQDAASLLVRGEGATYIVDGVIHPQGCHFRLSLWAERHFCSHRYHQAWEGGETGYLLQRQLRYQSECQPDQVARWPGLCLLVQHGQGDGWR
jgi:hypothetical protein